jgi:hypothetical protein
MNFLNGIFLSFKARLVLFKQMNIICQDLAYETNRFYDIHQNVRASHQMIE